MAASSLFLLILFSTAVFAQTDYCSIPCEQAGATHVACNLKQCTFGPSCDGKNPVYHDLTTSERQLMLDLNNRRRNQIASGSLSGFESANKMQLTTWDNELATIATYNLRECRSYDDQCRGSSKYPRAGENVGTIFTFPGTLTPTQVIQQVHDAWFNEYQNANMAQINNFPNPQPTGNQEIGHFTQIVRDDCPQIGCAMVSYVNNGQNTWDVTCLYAQENTNNASIYTTGVPCSSCLNGCDSIYTSLCAAAIASDQIAGICEVGPPSSTSGGTGGSIAPISSGNITFPNYSNMLSAMLQNLQNSYPQTTQVEKTECKKKPCEKKRISKKHFRNSQKLEIASIITYEFKKPNNAKIGRTVLK